MNAVILALATYCGLFGTLCYPPPQCIPEPWHCGGVPKVRWGSDGHCWYFDDNVRAWLPENNDNACHWLKHKM